MGMQLSLFDDVRTPTWEDAQKKRAYAVRHGAYVHPCISSCMWADDVQYEQGKPRFCMNCGAFFKEYDELRGDAE